jgi:signal transduction histidine kinase/ActR/RegA family two-component response regulator
MSRPRWHLLYFVLAAFDLLAVGLGVWLTHRLLGMHQETVASHQAWAAQAADFARLGDLAVAVARPVNEALREGVDPLESSRAMRIALEQFEGRLRTVRDELTAKPEQAQSHLTGLLDALGAETRNLAGEAQEGFRQLLAGDRARAAGVIGRMNQRTAALHRAAHELHTGVRFLQSEDLARQSQKGAALQRSETVLALLILLMVGGVTWYGTTLHRRIRGADEKMRQATVEIEAARARAEASNRGKSEFLAGVSHELRTPMTAILGFTDVILEQDSTLDDCRNAAQTIQRNGQHLLRLINDILDLSKAEAGRFEIAREPVELGPLLHDLVETMRGPLGERPVDLQLELGPGVPTRVTTDPTRLRQALLNLLGNALKFTTAGTVHLAVTCDREAQLLTLQVVDSGIGMSELQIGRLFQPFVQAESGITKRYGGTGLGLVLARQLARLLGGDLVVESTLGVGSRFVLTIDTGSVGAVPELTEAAIDTAQPAAPATAPPGLADTRVLLVEDSADNQRLLQRILTKAGATVTLRDNGRDGMEAALQASAAGEPFDVVLMDMQMPVMSGHEATRRLRSQGYRGPILALTASTMRGDEERCREAGCDGFLSKPIDRRRLLEAVAGSRCAPAPSAAAAPAAGSGS